MPSRPRTSGSSATGGIGGALQKGSHLHGHVKPGIQALEARDKNHIEASLRQDFHDSLALDKATAASNPSANRWDYILGMSGKEQLIGLEVHPATPGEVNEVIKKKEQATQVMQQNLRPERFIHMWFWSSSGTAGINPNTTEYRRLVSAGIVFVGKTLCRADIDTM
jgi:hypothetical protein